MTIPNTGEVTLGEVGRKVDSLAESVKGLASKVDERPNWQDLKRVEDVWQAKHDAQTKDIAAMSSWQTWAGRLMLGGVATAILGVVLVPWSSL